MIRAAGLALLLAVVVAAPAGASRPATRGEQERVARSAGFPGRCMTVRISSRNAQWAAGFGHPGRKGCELAGGFGVFHLRDAEWHNVYHAFDDNTRGPCSEIAGVPAAVARDLHTCK